MGDYRCSEKMKTNLQPTVYCIEIVSSNNNNKFIAQRSRTELLTRFHFRGKDEQGTMLIKFIFILQQLNSMGSECFRM